MSEKIISVVGSMMILALCAWAVYVLSKELRHRWKTGTAVDRTLSEHRSDDYPAVFGLQITGYVALIIASLLIGVVFFVRLVGALLGK